MALSSKNQYWIDVLFGNEVRLPGTGGVIVPAGGGLERPSPAENGTIRYNTSSGLLESYESGAWGPLGRIVLANARASKLTDTTRTNDSVVTIDPILQVSVGTNKIYKIEGYLIINRENMSDAPDFTFDIADPGSTFFHLTVEYMKEGTTSVINGHIINGQKQIVDMDASGARYYCKFIGTLDTTSAVSSGITGIRWAQNNMNANGTILEAGSWIEITDMA